MGALVRNVKRDRIKRGMVVCLPGSMTCVKSFIAQIYVRLSALVVYATADA